MSFFLLNDLSEIKLYQILTLFCVQVALVFTFTIFISAVSLIRDQRMYTKIQNSRTFSRLFAILESIRYKIQLYITIFGPYSTPSLFAVSELAVFCQNVSTANYEGHLYLYQSSCLINDFYKLTRCNSKQGENIPQGLCCI